MLIKMKALHYFLHLFLIPPDGFGSIFDRMAMTKGPMNGSGPTQAN
jgi:hypothetical protein